MSKNNIRSRHGCSNSIKQGAFDVKKVMLQKDDHAISPNLFEAAGRKLSHKSFREAGLSIADWAREHKFNPRLVYAVLRDERKCLRGESFAIAKELGMK